MAALDSFVDRVAEWIVASPLVAFVVGASVALILSSLAYVVARRYLTFLVRHLQPSPEGLPIEVYVFANETAWVAYEGIQADIFDHILAIVPEFGLRIFQKPSGLDFRDLVRAGS